MADTTQDIEKDKGPGTDSAVILKDTKSSEWMASQIGEYLRSGKVAWNVGEGMYLGPKEAYMEDSAVKKAIATEYGDFNEMIFDKIYDSINQSFTQEVRAAQTEYRNKYTAPKDPFMNEGNMGAFASLASLDQRMYDDYSINIGDSRYLSEYSHREGKTDNVMGPDGIIYDVDYLGGVDGIKNNDKFLKNGKRPIFFSYVGEQMHADNKGGYIVPVYEGEDFVKSLIASNKDIDDSTVAWRESHGIHGIIKTPLNFAISSIDNIALETSKNVMRLAYGEDVKNYSVFNTLNDWSGALNASAYSYSDEADSLTSMEGILKMATEVTLQVGMMMATGGLGGKGLAALGVAEGNAAQYANWVARASMTAYAAGDISQQGAELGLSQRSLALTWVAGLASLWYVNSAFNWMEEAVTFNAVKNQAIKQATSDVLGSLPKGKLGVAQAFKAGETWAKKVANSINYLKTSGSTGSAVHQLGFSSLNETFQEASEFTVQELVQNVSNIVRYASSDEEERDSFVGYRSMSEAGYWTDYFIPALGVNMLGGAIGGPIGRLMGVATGNRFVASDANVIVSALINGEGSALEAAAKDIREKGLAADTQLSTIKGANGEFVSMAEAATLDPNPMSLNDFAVLRFEDEINYHTKVMNELKILGIGEGKYAKVKAEMPGLEDHISSYDIGSEISKAYATLKIYIDRGIYSEDIVHIKDSIATINQNYFDKLQEINEDQEIDEIERDRRLAQILRDTTTAQDKVDAEAAYNSNGKFTKEDIRNIRESIQYIEDVKSGRASEKLFVKFLYQSDKGKKSEDRRFEMLDGNPQIESIKRIHEMANVLSEVRATLDIKYTNTKEAEELNNKYIMDAKDYVDAIGNLTSYDGIMYVSDEAKQKLTDLYNKDSVSIDELKTKMKDSIDALTNEDLQEFSMLYKYADKMAVLDGGSDAFKLTPEGEIDDVAAEKQMKEIWKEDIDSIDSDSPNAFNMLKNIRFREHDGGDIMGRMESGRLRNATKTEIYRNVFKEALMVTKAVSDEKLGGKPLDEVIDGMTELEAKDMLDQRHLLAGLVEKDGKIDWDKGFFKDSVKVLEDELRQSTNPVTNINTFPLSKFDRAEQLLKEVETRLTFLDFMQSLEENFITFRDYAPNLFLLQSRLDKDKDLTKLNRAFERIMYNPSVVADLVLKDKLGILNDDEKVEFRTVKSMLMRFKDSVDFEELQRLEKLAYEAETELRNEAAKDNPDSTMLQVLNISFADAYAAFEALSSTTTIGSLKSLTVRLQSIIAKKDNRLDADNGRIVSYKGAVEEKQFEFKTFILPTLANILAEYKDEEEFTKNEAYLNFMKLDDLTESSSGHAKVMETMILLEDLIYNTFHDNAIETVSKLTTAYTKYYSSHPNAGNTIGASNPFWKSASLVFTTMVTSKSSDFFSKYKGYIGKVSESTNVGPLLPYAANMEQIQNSRVAYAFFQNDDFNDIVYKASVKSGVSPDRVDTVSNYIMGIVGMLGSGKTVVVGMMPLKMAQDDRKRDQKYSKSSKALAIGPNVDIREGLNDRLIDNNIDVSGLQNMNTTEFIVDMINNPDKYSNKDTDLGYIVIDEASFINNESDIHNVIVTDIPSYKNLVDAINIINNRRTGHNLPPLKILLLGDPRQNGYVGKDKSGTKVKAGVFDSDSLLVAPYMFTSERSLVSVLKNSYGAWLNLVGVTLLSTTSLEMEYGYDSLTNDLLGVSLIRDFSNLDDKMSNFDNQSIISIITDKMRQDESYKIAIVSDVISDKIAAIPENLKKLYDEFGEDRVLVRSHENIQGREVSFVFAHIDSDNFGDSINDSILNQLQHTAVGTTLGRATLGGVLINSTGRDITSTFVSNVTSPKIDNIKIIGSDLIKLQKRSLEDLNEVVPDGGAIRPYKYGSQEIDDYVKANPILVDLLKRMNPTLTIEGIPKYTKDQLSKLIPIKNTKAELEAMLFMAEYIMREDLKSPMVIPEFTTVEDAKTKLEAVLNDMFLINSFTNYDGMIINKVLYPFNKKTLIPSFNSKVEVLPGTFISVLDLLKKYKGVEINTSSFAYTADPKGTEETESPFEEMPDNIMVVPYTGTTINPITGKAIVTKSDSEIIKDNKKALTYYKSKETKHKNGNGPPLTADERRHKTILENDSEIISFSQNTTDYLITSDDEMTDIDYMKMLDDRGILGMYTGNFDSGIKGIPIGNRSLISAAVDALTSSEFKGKIMHAEIYNNSNKFNDTVDSEYTELRYDILNDNVTPAKYFMFSYKSTVDGEVAYNSIIAAELNNGNIVILGNFNNIKDAGDTLNNLRNATKRAIKSGVTILSEWSPNQFSKLFPRDSTTGMQMRSKLSPGKLVPSPDKAFRGVADVRTMLKDKGYKTSKIYIVKDRNHKLSGKAVMFYSLNKSEDFNDVKELPIDSVFGKGLKNGVGMIVLEPTSKTIAQLFKAFTRNEYDFINPTTSSITPFYDSLMMDRVHNLLVPLFAHIMHTYYTTYPDVGRIHGTDMAILEKVANSARTKGKKRETEDGIVYESYPIKDLITPELTKNLKAFFKSQEPIVTDLFPVGYKEYKTPFTALMNSLRLIVGSTSDWAKYKRDANGNIVTIEKGKTKTSRNRSNKRSPDIEQSDVSIISFFDAESEESGGFTTQQSRFDLIRLFRHFTSNQSYIYRELNIDGKKEKDSNTILMAIFGQLDSMLAVSPKFTNGIKVYPAADRHVGLTNVNTSNDVNFYYGEIYGVGEEYLESNVVDVAAPILYLSDDPTNEISLFGNKIEGGTQIIETYNFNNIEYTQEDIHVKSTSLFNKLGLLDRFNKAKKSKNGVDVKSLISDISELQATHIRLKAGIFQSALDELKKINVKTKAEDTGNEIMSALTSMVLAESTNPTLPIASEITDEVIIGIDMLERIPMLVSDSIFIDRFKSLISDNFSSSILSEANKFLIARAKIFNVADSVESIGAVTVNESPLNIGDYKVKKSNTLLFEALQAIADKKDGKNIGKTVQVAQTLSSYAKLIVKNSFIEGNTAITSAFGLDPEKSKIKEGNIDPAIQELVSGLDKINYKKDKNTAFKEAKKLFKEYNGDNVEDIASTSSDLITLTVVASVMDSQAKLVEYLTSQDLENSDLVTAGREIADMLRFEALKTKFKPTDAQFGAIMEGVDYTDAAKDKVMKSVSLKMTALDMYGIILNSDDGFIDDIVFDEDSIIAVEDNIRKIKSRTFKCI